MNKIESPKKNFYLFLFKILKESYPIEGEEWLKARRILQANGRRNISWKRILNHLIGVARIRGPSSNQWQTIIRQLEILKNIQNYMRDPSGREIVGWRNKESRTQFISLCEDRFPIVVSEVRTAIHRDSSHYCQQLLDDLNDSLWGNQVALNHSINFQEEEEKEFNYQSYFLNIEEINQGFLQSTQNSNNSNGITEEGKSNQLDSLGEFSLFNTNPLSIENQTTNQNAFEFNSLNMSMMEGNSPLIGVNINEPNNNSENTRQVEEEVRRLREENEQLKNNLREILEFRF